MSKLERDNDRTPKTSGSRTITLGPVDNLPAGIQVDGGHFIPWSRLLPEIRFKLLPQVEALNRYDGKFEILLKDLHGRRTGS
jgi:hypothetical protein